jgi:hypothetical protein
MIQEASTRTRKRKPRYTEEQRAQIVAEYEAREGGLVDFCEAKGVSAGSLFTWRRRMRGAVNGCEADEKKRGWVELPWATGRTAGPAESGGVWVEFRSGPLVAAKIAAGADPRWAARILEALGCGA